MSLYVTMEVNDDLIGTVAITRTTSHGEHPDSVNYYRWSYRGQAGPEVIGHLEHRYGDGAIALAARVFADLAEQRNLAQEANRG